MVWPISDVNTGNADAGTDNPATFRTDVLDLLNKFNQLRAHVSMLGQTILNRATAAQMRADLGAQPIPTETSGTTAGTGTAYTFTPTTPITAYTTHLSFWVKFHAVSGASPTLTISGLATPPALVRYNANGALVNIGAGDLPANFTTRVTLLSATQALVEKMPIAAGLAADATATTQINSDRSAKVATTQWVQNAMSSIASTAGFSAQFAPTGYVKFPSWLGGLVVQWGGSSSINGILTFPLAFPTSCFSVAVSGTNAMSYIASASSFTTTGFDAYGLFPNIGRSAAPVSYIAIGN